MESHMRRLVSRVNLCVVVVAALLVPPVTEVCAEEPEQFSIEWIDTTAFPVNTVYYTTVDAAGRPADPLWAPDHVAVTENGEAALVGGFEDGGRVPGYLSIIIDSSGSMEDSLSDVLTAAELLINQLRDSDRAEIIDFDTEVTTRRAFTRDRAAMRRSLAGITVGGGTALFDAVAVGFDHLRDREGMRSVLVLSDGEDENSTAYTYEQLMPRLKNDGVRVFTIGLGDGVDRTTMTGIAEASGGAFYHAATAADVDEIYSEVITYLHSLHRFWYSTPLGMFDGGRRNVTVRHTPNGAEATANYEAPAGETWSHAILYDENRSAAPVKISPDGRFVSQIEYRTLIDATGRRISTQRWNELYDGSMTDRFVCGYTHRAYGRLERYNVDDGTYREVSVWDDAASVGGSFDRDRQWYPKAISPNERYVIMSAAAGDDVQYNYVFLLYDRVAERVIWEDGFYTSDFDEPGAVAVADNGLAAITQEGNLFLVPADRSETTRLMANETGRRWELLDMDASGSLILGRNPNDDAVWLYDTDGSMRWERRSRCHEHGGFLAISPSGTYVAYADRNGPHVLTPAGEVLFELPAAERGEGAGRATPWHATPNGVDIADTGAFVYSLGNRIYYRDGL